MPTNLQSVTIQSKLSSDWGELAIVSTKKTSSSDTTSSLPALLLIHGNSFSSQIFRHLLTSPAIASNASQVIAFDLPGHGDSSDAPDPESTYGMLPYAKAALAVCEHMDVKEVVVLGWSLGGHIAIEMIPLSLEAGSTVKVKGVFIIGTPPVAANEEDIRKGFLGGSSVAGTEHLSTEEKETFAHGCADLPYEDWMQTAVNRTHGLARRLMFAGFVSGASASNQRQILEDGVGDVLVGVLNGKDEPFINVEYVSSVRYKNLWKGESFQWEKCLHAPFWGRPQDFEKLFVEYLQDVSKRGK